MDASPRESCSRVTPSRDNDVLPVDVDRTTNHVSVAPTDRDQGNVSPMNSSRGVRSILMTEKLPSSSPPVPPPPPMDDGQFPRPRCPPRLRVRVAALDSDGVCHPGIVAQRTALLAPIETTTLLTSAATVAERRPQPNPPSSHSLVLPSKRKRSSSTHVRMRDVRGLESEEGTPVSSRLLRSSVLKRKVREIHGQEEQEDTQEKSSEFVNRLERSGSKKSSTRGLSRPRRASIISKWSSDTELVHRVTSGQQKVPDSTTTGGIGNLTEGELSERRRVMREQEAELEASKEADRRKELAREEERRLKELKAQALAEAEHLKLEKQKDFAERWQTTLLKAIKEEDATRLKFRCPGGEILQETFDRSAPLNSSVRTYLGANGYFFPEEVSLLRSPDQSIAFGSEDGDKTLEHLGLFPSQVLIVQPKSGEDTPSTEDALPL